MTEDTFSNVILKITDYNTLILIATKKYEVGYIHNPANYFSRSILLRFIMSSKIFDQLLNLYGPQISPRGYNLENELRPTLTYPSCSI